MHYPEKPQALVVMLRGMPLGTEPTLVPHLGHCSKGGRCRITVHLELLSRMFPCLVPVNNSPNELYESGKIDKTEGFSCTLAAMRVDGWKRHEEQGLGK